MTQAELARAGGTSQPAIAAYEANRKSPTISTVQRLARAVGLDAAVEYFPPLTREDRRSLGLHRASARRLRENPDAVLAQARHCLANMMARQEELSLPLREWSVLLDRPVEALLPLNVAGWLLNRKREELVKLESRYGATIVIEGRPDMLPAEVELSFKKREVEPEQEAPQPL